MKLNTIFNMDCLKGMKDNIENESIDVIVTSPPYNIGINYNYYNDNKQKEEFLEWFLDIAHELFRVLKRDGSFFLNIGGKPSDPLWPIEVAKKCSEVFTLQNTIHWIKSISIAKEEAGEYPHVLQDISVGHFKPVNSRCFMNNCHEYIFHFTKSGDTKLDKLAIGVEYQDKSNRARWKSAENLRDRGNCWFIPYETINKSRPHPSTFPVKLPEMCIKLHGLNKTKIVLDPFMGIGTTAAACSRLGINFIGFEIDKKYIQISNEWIRELKKNNDEKEKYLIGRGTKMFKIVIENISPKEAEPLLQAVEGQGGFQSLIRKLQRQYSDKEHLLILESDDIEKIVRYSKEYGSGGFQNRISAIINKIKTLHDKLGDLIDLEG